MRARTTRWVVAASIAAIAHLGLYWSLSLLNSERSFGLGDKPDNQRIVYRDSRSIGEGTVAEKELAMLLDPKPLLLPTEWNTARVEDIDEIYREDQIIFDELKPEFQEESGDYSHRFGNPSVPHVSVADTQLSFEFRRTEMMGRRKKEVRPAIEDAIRVMIRRPRSGEVVFQKSLYYNVAPKLESIRRDWEPALLLADVEHSFFSQNYIWIKSTGYQEIDELIPGLLSDEILPRGTLSDGPYLIEIFP